MVKMIATRRVKYPHGRDGREYAPGEAFEAMSERDAKGLFISGRAKRVDITPKPVDLPDEVMKRGKKAMEPEQPVKSDPRPDTTKPAEKEASEEPNRPLFGRRQYRRRDLTAEE